MIEWALPAPYQEFLAHTGLGPYLFWISVVVILGSALFFVCDLVLYIAVKRGVKLGMALVFIGFGLMALGAVVGFYGAREVDSSKEAAPRPSQSPSSPTSEVSILLDFSHDVLPRIAPPNGIIELRQNASGVENEVIDWRKALHPDWPIFGVARCEITTSGDMPVLEASFTMDLKFREMIPHTPDQEAKVGDMVQARTGGQQMISGDVVLTQQAGLKIDRIYRNAPYVIYFMNRTKYLAVVKVPGVGTALQIGKSWTDADREQKLNLKLSRAGEIYLSAH